MNEVDRLKHQRSELKRRYGDAYARLSAILFAEDPIGINFDENTDEYEPEVGTILPHLDSCRSVEEVNRLLYSEFVRWFGVATAGPPTRYRRIAERVWEGLCQGNSAEP